MPAAPTALLTVDFEDYRRHVGRGRSPEARNNPDEVMRQLELTLATFEALGATSTFFCVGRLASYLPSSAWAQIAARHRIGCHSLEHHHVREQGAAAFAQDAAEAREALQDASGQPVISYRAPYFSCDGCHPWFGRALAEAGFTIDSSVRLSRMPAADHMVLPLAGSDGQVTEVPMLSLGAGGKRLTVIGGTYFRLLPLSAILGLLASARRQGFLPMIYLHPYDLDPEALPIDRSGGALLARLRWRAADGLREAGRQTAADKLYAIAERYTFTSVEDAVADLARGDRPPAAPWRASSRSATPTSTSPTSSPR